MSATDLADAEPALRPTADAAAIEAPPAAEPRPAAWPSVAALAAALPLAACGGGGGDSASPSPSPTPTPTPTPVPTPVPAPPPAQPTDASAARFLTQAGFNATPEAIATVKAQGYAAWLDAEFAKPLSQSHFDWMIAKGYGGVDFRNDFRGVDNTIWRKLISSPDALRQRVVLALSEIFVVSMAGIPVAWRGMAVASYLDMLEAKAFTSYRELLEGVTLSNAMGVYLNMRGNQKENTKTGRVPDENYAREVMQLFSIGLYQLNLDGSLKLNGGKPMETYGQAEITELAKVLTGWEFDGANADDPSFMRKPMVNIATRFSTGPKRVLNVSIPETADGPAALKIVLDTLANHANTAPFISRQLIQRLVCSNPSPAYVQRVATVFNNNGQGQRGDMKAVLKAILLDSEARSPAGGPDVGKLREPVQRFVQWARLAGLTSPTELWNIGDLSNPANRLGQSPLRSPSVFNFFRPGYVPPNSVLGDNKVTAPEFQLLNESTVAGYLNFMQSVIANGIGELKPVYTAFDALALDPPKLVAQLALLLGGDTISGNTQALIANAIGAIAASNVANDAGRLNRVRATVLMLMACPEYLIQK
ncbi:DUF1800 domain-containing protein [Pelomonas sp. BJYL3]|uniref:DUF1800 domain-containing protein n=1 Tax=Pelomonas sp. BJYL3 TaxID=2976697 RepID=UPI0022B32339|nr:DUF1800 domain-containing protein [Pelomonas sp. BJYL3]